MGSSDESEQKIDKNNQTNAWRSLFDRIAPIYEEQYGEHPFWILYNDITWANIKRYLPENKEIPVLDAGGGTGFWSRKLAELGYRVICADISLEMLHQGRKRVKDTPITSRIDFVCMDLVDMGAFPDGFFSLVLIEGDPLSYCSDPEKAVKEMARVAQDGAHVVASVDSFFGALWRMVQAQDFHELDMLLQTRKTTYQGRTQHNFTVEELRDLYQSSGLEVIDIVGKPILTMAIPWEKAKGALHDQTARNEILNLELMFNSNPNIVGLGNHLEIVGRKK